VNKVTLTIGVSIIMAAVALATWGLLEKVAYEYCLEMIRAFERGESNITPQCRADESGKFLFPAWPVGIVGIVVLIMGIKDLPLLSSPARM
jgi:hypothetical protein